MQFSSAPTGNVSHDVYFRRRVVAGLAVLAVVVAVCLGIRTLASRGDGTASLPAVTPQSLSIDNAALDPVSLDLSLAYVQGTDFYIVQQGDTLWSIASSLTDGNLRNYVDELVDLNGGASVDIGQRLVLPTE
jgi:hypothetical protein